MIVKRSFRLSTGRASLDNRPLKIELMSSRTKDLGESFLQSGELDEDDDSDSLLADELRGMYRNKLKDMDKVEEKREEAHRVR